MSKLKMNCGYCGRKCDLDKDFCIPQDSVYVCKSCYDWQNRVADLEAKLAEKDELIGTLKNKYECADRELYLTKDTLKHHTNIYNSLVESRNQDKISFAVGLLEKLKIELHYLHTDRYLKLIDEEIDNQIEELKKEMK